jgi:ATP-binding cassette subfamily B protein
MSSTSGVLASESDKSVLSGAELKETRDRAYRLLVSTLRPRVPLLTGAALVSILAALLEALAPLFLAKGIDVALPALRGGDSGPVWLIGGMFAVACVVMGFSYWLSKVLTARLSQAALMDIRERLFRKVQRLPMSFHERHTSGRTIARQTSDMDTIQEFLDGGVSEVLATGLYLIFTIGLVITLDPQSGLVIGIFLVGMYLLMRWFLSRSEIAFREQRTHSARLIVTFVETFTGIRAVQAFRREDEQDAKYSASASAYHRSTMNSVGLFGIMMPTITAIGNMCMVAVLAWGGCRALEGTLTVGTLAAVVLASKRVFGPLQGILMYISSLQSAQSALEKVSALLEEPEHVAEPSSPVDLSERGPGLGEVVFDHVSFGYTPEQPLIADLSLMIPAGQTVAVVGQTGAGKSTLAKLISRFYDVTAGSVRLDGVDLREMSDADLRRRVVMVTQEAYLFSGSVADNIALGKPGATREEVMAAARAVGAHEFIEALPDGYDTDVNKRGGRVSAGQRQLISFARAFIADPRVLILDEATSSLDIPSERLVQEGLATLLGDRTALIIAHRLSTVAIADRVIVVQDGRIAEDGTPEELITAGGEFAVLDAAWKKSLA